VNKKIIRLTFVDILVIRTNFSNTKIYTASWLLKYICKWLICTDLITKFHFAMVMVIHNNRIINDVISYSDQVLFFNLTLHSTWNRERCRQPNVASGTRGVNRCQGTSREAVEAELNADNLPTHWQDQVVQLTAVDRRVLVLRRPKRWKLEINFSR